MNINRSSLITVVGFVLSSAVSAASVTVSGEGSNFVINKIGGFDGVDGAARETAFVAAARVWADILISPVDIVVDAEFSSALFCVSNSATLGSAGPLNTYLGSGAESFGLQNSVWYPTALINAHYGSDYFPANADISASFNADIGDADCLNTSGWYYGTDGNAPAGMIDFYEVVLHELGHGLGILSLVNSNGTYNGGVVDIFSSFLKDQQTNKQWTAMNNTERNASVLNSGNLVWTGAGVTALVDQLSAGVSAGNVQMYAPSPYEGGSSISHFDTALTPNELMEPQYTGDASLDHSIALLEDIGWELFVAQNNVVPLITGQSVLSLNEDASFALSLNQLTVTDADNSYPADFTLTVSAGQNYTVSGTVISPNENYNGALTVPVTVNDGTDSSASYNLTVTVDAVNDKPSITGQNTLSLNEDTSITLTTDELTIVDPDDSEFSLIIGSGSNYSVAGAQITPNSNFNGSLTVPVTVNDGDEESDTFNMTISVSAVNDKPVITATPVLSVNEDESVALSISDFSITDNDSTEHSLTILAGDNYSVIDGRIYPSENFTGLLSIDVFVSDAFDDGAIDTLTVSVLAVNDAPLLTSDNLVTSLIVGDSLALPFTASDIDSESLSFSLSSSLSSSLDWLSINDSGLLSGIPSVSALGNHFVTVSVSDGEASDSISFELTVMDFDQADLSVALSLNKALIIENESSTLTATVINNGPAQTATGHVLISFADGTFVDSIPAACQITSLTEVRCAFTDLADSVSFGLTVGRQNALTQNITAQAFANETDAISNNDSAVTTLLVVEQLSAPELTHGLLAEFNTQAIDFADVDGDGKQEVLLANGSGTTEQIFEFDGSYDATTLSAQLSENSNARDITSADFNNDGLLDIVVANEGENHLYLNLGRNQFDQPQALGSQISADALAVDVNNDDFLDLIFANEGANTLYLNDQAGQFTGSSTFGNSNSSAMDSLDFNGDGFADIIVANHDADDLIYLNNGADQSAGVFNQNAIVVGTALTESHAVKVVDFNQDDKKIDILVGKTITATNQTGLEIYQISGSVIALEQSLLVASVSSFDVADYDGNGELDILLLQQNEVIQLFVQTDDLFEPVHNYLAQGAQSVRLLDINGDTKADIAVAYSEVSESKLYISDNAFVTRTEPEAVDPVSSSEEPSPVSILDSAPSQPEATNQQPEPDIVVVQSGSLAGVCLLLSVLLLALRRAQPRLLPCIE